MTEPHSRVCPCGTDYCASVASVGSFHSQSARGATPSAAFWWSVTVVQTASSSSSSSSGSSSMSKTCMISSRKRVRERANCVSRYSRASCTRSAMARERDDADVDVKAAEASVGGGTGTPGRQLRSYTMALDNEKREREEQEHATNSEHESIGNSKSSVSPLLARSSPTLSFLFESLCLRACF